MKRLASDGRDPAVCALIDEDTLRVLNSGFNFHHETSQASQHDDSQLNSLNKSLKLSY